MRIFISRINTWPNRGDRERMYCACHRSAQDHVRGLGARLRELLHGIFRPLGVGELLAVFGDKGLPIPEFLRQSEAGQHRWPVAFIALSAESESRGIGGFPKLLK
jgi:hypothetical protein